MKYAIESKSLTKKYGDFTAVDSLEIKVPEGKVYGFLGRNGSGKTTTIRMIMGLIKPDLGKVKIFGKEVNRNDISYLKDIGAIIETPGFYNNLSGYENLEITCELFNTDKKSIEKSLDIVGLSKVDNQNVGTFSLGMKQRLGIANALIHSPKILILDEPTNGLDPMGIIEMRGLIKNLSKTRGITILVSSHLLSEIQLIADYVGIIDNGRLIMEGHIDSIDIDQQNYLILETSNNKKAEKILNSLNFEFEKKNDSLKIYCEYNHNSMINKKMIENNLEVYNLKSHLKTLEERFLGIADNHLTKKGD
ncbi:ATP-binding cassette domain-containing protein [Methanobrevibacter sp. TMH8]|uniref:ABC transporter ATP-binding protein n=1 Tax=Methanobrevibacter sp. TMH8 TaxID=2848611 RepID=UPI001CC93BC5|nr:ATP-binding cassette domain-containing protein [Methanobrevibacter sp. TMH8]MBZ9570148.1 ATP-binding cassette domain-containing protein [Methanobrevibacter sp. TMH8]